MKSRRDFFRQFVGQMGVLRDEFIGVECIPLNRLNELPFEVIEQIEPVFFSEEPWKINGSIFHSQVSASGENVLIELNSVEIEALEYFKKSTKLKQTVIEIKKNSELNYNEIYDIVSSLFFRLASLRICHPRDAHPISEILNKEKSNKNGQL